MTYYLRLILFLSFYSPILNATITKQPLIISIPKCGTHLLQKCISLINKDKKLCRYTHQRYYPNQKLNNTINFFIIRDPRDQLISLIYHVLIRIDWYKDDPKMKQELHSLWDYENLSFSDKIYKLINEGASYYNIYSSPGIKGINEFYKTYLGWKTQKDICFIKFENLVGPNGGGNLAAQLSEIKKISKHLNIAITDLEVSQIAKKLFGDAHTFRKGKIGSWKEHFTSEHKKAFKKNAGNLLIELDYEKDLKW